MPIHGSEDSTPNRKVVVRAAPLALPVQIDVTLVADAAFPGSQSDSESILAGVISQFSAQSPSFRSSFYLKKYKFQGWPNDNGGGPGSGLNDINAYNLLCDFAQDDWQHPEPSGPKIVFLLSGKDLDSVQKTLGFGIRDIGDTICSADCASNGKDIIGLAEGRGGFRKSEPNDPSSRSCSKKDPHDQFPIPPDHHALGQMVGKKSPPPSPTSTTNYQALLPQEEKLMEHEFGHLVGAQHDTKLLCTQDNQLTGCIMWPVLTQTTSSKFSETSAKEIAKCVEGGC
jgi:hypothetical protein